MSLTVIALIFFQRHFQKQKKIENFHINSEMSISSFGMKKNRLFNYLLTFFFLLIT